MSLPDSIGVNVTLSVIKTGPHHSASISSIKDVTSFVKAEQRIIGMPTVAGKDGADGADGKAATVTIGTVETLPPGSNAYVRNSGTETDALLDIGIPRGDTGESISSWGDITGTLSDQTDLANALALKANVADLGDLATQDTVDYQTEVTNKPTLGSLASKDSVNYATEVTNKPSLGTMAGQNDAPSDNAEYVRKNGAWAVSSGGGGGGGTPTWGTIVGTLSNQTDLANALNAKADEADLGTMAFVNDAPSDSKEYIRKNGAWAESSGGGGGITSVSWGDIEGTLSDQTDLQTALDEKAPVIIDNIQETQSGIYVVVPIGGGIIDLKATYNVTQTGSGTPSASNIRPFVSTEKAIVMLANSYAVFPLSYESISIQLPSTIYGGVVDVINGVLTITHGHIASYNGETLPGVWYSDRDEYVEGTTPTVGAEVVYELETPVNQSFTGRTPRPFQSRDTYMWVTHAINVITNYTVMAVISHEGAVDTKTYIDQNDALKANVADLGDLAYEDDAPSDNAEYVRKNGSWAVSSGGGGGGGTPTWGSITGTMSQQTDLQTALDAKANVADLGDLATQDSVDYVTEVTNKPTLGTMSAVNDAPSDSKEYVRKNGAWAENSGITSVVWGDVTGTLSDQTDLATALNGKQNVLTFDSAPTTGSTNPVESGGVKTALDAKQDMLTFDTTPTVGSTNPVQSNGIAAAISQVTTIANGKVMKSGDTMTGNLTFKTILDPGTSSSSNFGIPVLLRDKNLTEIGRLQIAQDDNVYSDTRRLGLFTYRTVNGEEVNNGIQIGVDATGKRRYKVSDEKQFCADVLTHEILRFTDKATSVTTASAVFCTITDDKITANHVVTDCMFSTPTSITADVTWNTYDGYMTLTGINSSASNTVSVTLGFAGNL